MIGPGHRGIGRGRWRHGSAPAQESESGVTKIQHHPQTSSHRDHSHQTHTQTHHRRWTRPQATGRGRRVFVASLSCGPCSGDGEGAGDTHVLGFSWGKICC